MMKIKLELHKEDNILVLEPQDIFKYFDENEDYDLIYYLDKVIEYLNYPIFHNSEMAFDDGYYAKLGGWIDGFDYAKHLEKIDDGGAIEIKWKRKYQIEIPIPFILY